MLSPVLLKDGAFIIYLQKAKANANVKANAKVKANANAKAKIINSPKEPVAAKGGNDGALGHL